jgi:VWFA-related protein
MRRGLFLIGALVVAAFIIGAPPRPLDARPQDPQQPTFRAGVDVVSVDVSVRDRGRKPLADLRDDEFQVLDNGVPQRVIDVSYGKLPIDVTIALDVSFSVTGATLDRLRTAIAQLMRDFGRDDRLKLIFFNSRVMRVVDFTTDISAVEQAIRNVSAGGGTSILDAISVALISASHPDRRQLVVLFTDGNDSNSATDPGVLLGVAQRTTATLTVVMPGTSTLVIPGTGSIAPRAAPPASRQLLAYTALVADTGGSVIPVAANSDLTATFKSALEEFRTTYVLHFSPAGVDRGGFHTLQVNVTRPNAVTKARRGYFGG